MKYVLGACVVYVLKAFSLIFYKTEARWLTPRSQIEWEKLRLAIVLNHTSLFEPLFVSAIPNNRIWRAVKRVVVPIADVTMKRPVIGHIFRILAPNAVGITRKRDETWDEFVSKAKGDSLVLIFPEGRMKRKNGLDKNGKPMSVKGGVADILELMDSGKILIAYSGGLHHVQAPGEFLPRVFKKIVISFEQIDIAEYKNKLRSERQEEFKARVIEDLQNRMSLYCDEAQKSAVRELTT